MRLNVQFLFRFLAATLVAAVALGLASCGDSSTSGGSGVGGTGITTVSGNVASVTASAAVPGDTRLAWLDRVIEPAFAQSSGVPGVGGITVSGGGASTVTDPTGNFTLQGVVPSDNLVITFEVPGVPPIGLELGAVPAGAAVEVANIVIDTSALTATPGGINVESPGNAPVNTPPEEVPDGGPEGGTPAAETVTVCHQTGNSGVTLTVAESALDAHLGHGDSTGPCPESADPGSNNNGKGNGDPKGGAGGDGNGEEEDEDED